MAKDCDARDTAEIFNANIAHCVTSSAHVRIFPSGPPGKHPSQFALQKRMIWNFTAKFTSKKRNMVCIFCSKYVDEKMLMNHNTIQHCRALRLAQAATFTSQFLKADNPSITSGLASHVQALKLGSAYP
ncbi:hypothetical protein Cadr_000004681 [Camelus dromedarius]|uniref:Uncharacterized protein n=1 Tax=Camelus dromedarius TaxID=9838 RepID=A0A5N4EBR1_CAMDR|nr:hypothetical protein Cadr_000004681 [Camelus dromedarius]